MTLPESARPVQSPAQGGTELSQHDASRGVAGVMGVIGNERLTALAGALLFVLIVVELVTTASLRMFMSVHVFVGVLLAGPLAVKVGSTGYRFVRYYTRAPAYVRRGPPRLPLRLLAPVLVVTTIVLIGSGIGLVVVGPIQAGPLRVAHILDTLVWLPLLAIHAVAYFPRVPRLVAEDWSTHPTVPAAERGRGIRLGVNLIALLGGVIAAILLLPVAAPWIAWIQTNESGPGFFIVGMLLAALALVATRPLRWR